MVLTQENDPNGNQEWDLTTSPYGDAERINFEVRS